VLTDQATGKYEFLGKAQTCHRYPLVVASRYNIPFCLKEPGKGHRIIGEIYKVDENKLKALDELEAHPTFYCREIIEAELDNGEIIQTWIYVLPTWKPNLIADSSEMLDEYFSKGDHGREYISRYLRAQAIIEDNYNLIDDILHGSEVITNLQATLEKAKRDLNA